MFMEVLASAEPSQFGELATPGCVTDSVYKRGMKVVFRFELYDMDNKVRLTTADGTKAQVTLRMAPPCQRCSCRAAIQASPSATPPGRG